MRSINFLLTYLLTTWVSQYLKTDPETIKVEVSTTTGTEDRVAADWVPSSHAVLERQLIRYVHKAVHTSWIYLRPVRLIEIRTCEPTVRLGRRQSRGLTQVDDLQSSSSPCWRTQNYEACRQRRRFHHQSAPANNQQSTCLYQPASLWYNNINKTSHVYHLL